MLKAIGFSELQRQHGRLLEAVQLAYRFHHMGDEDVGSTDLSNALCDALCEAMGDDGFQAWSKEASPHGDYGPDDDYEPEEMGEDCPVCRGIPHHELDGYKPCTACGGTGSAF